MSVNLEILHKIPKLKRTPKINVGHKIEFQPLKLERYGPPIMISFTSISNSFQDMCDSFMNSQFSYFVKMTLAYLSSFGNFRHILHCENSVKIGSTN